MDNSVSFATYDDDMLNDLYDAFFEEFLSINYEDLGPDTFEK